MLHYFAKRFFSAKILSAYIEDDRMSVYYVNDDIHWPARGQSDISNTEQLRRMLLNVSHSMTSVLDSNMKSSADSWVHQMSTASDDLTVSGKQALNDNSSKDQCVVMLQCFHWDSFIPRAQWNVTFPPVCLLIYCTLLLSYV